jgi:hypothetical protein
VKDFGDRLMMLALSAAAAAFLLSLAWTLVSPIVPFLGALVIGVLLWRRIARPRL